MRRVLNREDDAQSMVASGRRRFSFHALGGECVPRQQTNRFPGAPLSPVLTFGGPSTVPARGTELAIAAGAWGNLFPRPCLHETGVN
jgi:hypothetical protein